MNIQQNISLQPYNTFGIAVKANQFAEITDKSQLKTVLGNNSLPLLILGGGSNLLLTKDFEGLVIKNNIKGIDILDEGSESITLKVGAGENWHEFVMYCVANSYCGVENLSLIPGNVGASPMQNIGAYGVEVKDVITKVETVSLSDYTIKEFTNAECKFGYRTSIFKTSHKNQYLISAVYFQLSKTPTINTSYGAINNELQSKGITNPTIKEVSDAVIAIRESKLPNPAEIGNSGSFFKNPVVSEEIKNTIIAEHENAPNYPQPNGTFKMAAGWLIEQCGWKGKVIGNYGVHDKQALVLVNHGGAKGSDIYQLSEDIIQSVKDKFNITLEREVNIL